MSRLSVWCDICAHVLPTGGCEAFPDGIPQAILEGQHDHHVPYPGDQGVQFELGDEYSDEDVANVTFVFKHLGTLGQAAPEERG